MQIEGCHRVLVWSSVQDRDAGGSDDAPLLLGTLVRGHEALASEAHGILFVPDSLMTARLSFTFNHTTSGRNL